MSKKRHFTKERMYGWHFRKESGVLTHGDLRVPKVGERLQARTARGRDVTRPGLCKPGFHAFPDLRSCGAYAHYGPLLSFVLLENVAGKAGCNKVSAQYRTILWQGKVPLHVNRASHSALEEWLKSAGFKRASATAKARVLRARRKRDGK